MASQNEDLETDAIVHREENHFDAAILYSEPDYLLAQKYLEIMTGLQLQNNISAKACLYDHPQFTPEATKNPHEVINYCTFIFCLCTPNLGEDRVIELIKEEAIGLTRLAKDGSRCPGLSERRYCVRPLINGKCDRLPAGLTTIRPIDMSDIPKAKQYLTDLFNQYAYLRLNREKKSLQKITYEMYMRQNQPSVDDRISRERYCDDDDAGGPVSKVYDQVRQQYNGVPLSSNVSVDCLPSNLCADDSTEVKASYNQVMTVDPTQNNPPGRKTTSKVDPDSGSGYTDVSMLEGDAPNVHDQGELQRPETKSVQNVYFTNCNYIQFGESGIWHVKTRPEIEPDREYGQDGVWGVKIEPKIEPDKEYGQDGSPCEETDCSEYEDEEDNADNIFCEDRSEPFGSHNHDSGISDDTNLNQTSNVSQTGAYTDEGMDRVSYASTTVHQKNGSLKSCRFTDKEAKTSDDLPLPHLGTEVQDDKISTRTYHNLNDRLSDTKTPVSHNSLAHTYDTVSDLDINSQDENSATKLVDSNLQECQELQTEALKEKEKILTPVPESLKEIINQCNSPDCGNLSLSSFIDTNSNSGHKPENAEKDTNVSIQPTPEKRSTFERVSYLMNLPRSSFKDSNSDEEVH